MFTRVTRTRVIVRELVEQGYAVIAPDYRGSNGYGGTFWQQIDYGGLEVEEFTLRARRCWTWHPEISTNRVGIIGWSHGGAIAFLAVVRHPEGVSSLLCWCR